MIYSRYNTDSIKKLMSSLSLEFDDIDLNIRDIGLSRGNGYGQYYAYILICVNGIDKKISRHTTNSQLFDCEDENEQQDGILQMIHKDLINYLYDLRN